MLKNLNVKEEDRFNNLLCNGVVTATGGPLLPGNPLDAAGKNGKEKVSSHIARRRGPRGALYFGSLL